MRAEIVSIGTELLLGEIIDTNAAYLGKRLAQLGVDCFQRQTVGDNFDRVRRAIELALSRSDFLICTGGLGPTEDDLTREAIAAALGETPAVDRALEGDLRSWFGTRGFQMPERNLKQAWLVPSARAIANPNGTAPGWWVRKDGKEIVAMPGVPREMTSMWEQHVEPDLARRGARLATRTLKLLGIGESAVEEALGDLVHGTAPTVATYAKADGVHVRLAAKGDDAEAAISGVERDIRERLGEHVWGRDAETLPSVIGGRLRAKGWRLAIRETDSAGVITSVLCDEGLADWFAGTVVGEAPLPEAEVTLEVRAAEGAVSAYVRTPEGTEQRSARSVSNADTKRRSVLVGLDALLRALRP